VARPERTNRRLPLVSDTNTEALPIYSPAQVFSCFLEAGRAVDYAFPEDRGGYLYLLEGGPLTVNGHHLPELAAAWIIQEIAVRLEAEGEAELLLVEVRLD
jgi:quercetin 2,3-dioxygenase